MKTAWTHGGKTDKVLTIPIYTVGSRFPYGEIYGDPSIEAKKAAELERENLLKSFPNITGLTTNYYIGQK